MTPTTLGSPIAQITNTTADLESCHLLLTLRRTIPLLRPSLSLSPMAGDNPKISDTARAILKKLMAGKRYIVTILSTYTRSRLFLVIEG
jgi:hypothetical protein